MKIMKRLHYKFFKPATLFAGIALTLTACNKDLPDATPITTATPTGQSITAIINTDAQLTILKAALAKAGASLTATLSDSTGVYTMFAPTDAAFTSAGINATVIGFLSAGRVDTLLRYHIIGGQKLLSASIPETFPNLQEPSLFVLAAPSATLPPGLRMPLFPSRRGNIVWVNNIPVIAGDIAASNGVIHKVAAVVAPPSQFLWDRINTDTDLTYLKAAIQRADSGVVAAGTLQAALQNPAASLSVFAPSDAAFRQIITLQITGALIAQGLDPVSANATATVLASTPAVFSNPLLYSVLTPTNVKGVVVYHLLGKRAFSVNIPAAATAVPTLLNTAIAVHPGVTVQATFGLAGVTSATIKGLGNATASNVAVNPTPAPGGTSDQHYINGVLHKIDQVLLPQ